MLLPAYVVAMVIVQGGGNGNRIWAGLWKDWRGMDRGGGCSRRVAMRTHLSRYVCGGGNGGGLGGEVGKGGMLNE